ncbi:hypothetical protein BKA62DRAFT_774312 [Auriculariales sp. MPI-PUGE-AT-0066]|nr:hypothetical protein BKA62DRAFT_774312 [Auriculariales sp. MPI-PUGE-AT-0066]
MNLTIKYALAIFLVGITCTVAARLPEEQPAEEIIIPAGCALLPSGTIFLKSIVRIPSAIVEVLM